MIDNIMSRFKIRTKVIVLVAPLVLSISAVGLTGLYASGLLQGRMEISNSVLQSLTGFKSVFSSISEFLRNPTTQAHERAASDVETQGKLLKQTIDGLAGQTDVSLLRQASDQSSTISANVEKLWSLEVAREDLMKKLADAQKKLSDVQGDIGKKSFKLVADAKRKEKAQKTALKNALDLDTTSTKLDALITDYAKVLTDQDKIAVLNKYIPDLGKDVSKVQNALPKNKLPYGKKFEKQLQTLSSIASSANPAADQIVKAGGLINSFRTSASMFRQISGDMMRQAILDLAASDKDIARAESVSNKLKAIINDNNEIRVVFAELMVAPDEAGVKKVQQSLYMFNTEVERLAGVVRDDPFFQGLPKEIKPVIDGLGVLAASLATNETDKQTEFKAAASQIDETWNLLTAFAEQQKQSAGAERDQANRISVGAMVLGIIIAMAAGAALVITLRGPIAQITQAMARLAQGLLDISISGDKRPDEIGEMARALTVFKANAMEKLTIEEQAEKARVLAEAERERNEAERTASAREIEFAVRQLAEGLGNLARGELGHTLDAPFAGHLDSLRNDFNNSVAGLRRTMEEIRSASGLIQDSGQQMAEAADDLSRRTEQQAASLEETAAAVEQITATVKTSSSRAAEAQSIVSIAKKSADSSSVVVANAVSAMGRIREASDKIGQIIDVIDSIAFQTNLLALNAGVEAARAGEAGKGFAVVAQEVRELAQRSATAAREIGELIARSADEVSTGSRYVEQTGKALTEIAHHIVDISGHVDLIATSAHEQSASLTEINGTVAQMDQMTQRNAAMVEETNAATRQLAEEADILMSLVARFNLDKAQYREQTRAA